MLTFGDMVLKFIFKERMKRGDCKDGPLHEPKRTGMKMMVGSATSKWPGGWSVHGER